MQLSVLPSHSLFNSVFVYNTSTNSMHFRPFFWPLVVGVIPGLIGVITWNSANKQQAKGVGLQ